MNYVEIYAAAHRSRAEAIRDLFAAVRDGIVYAVRKVFGMDARSKAIRELRALDARVLSDIGLTVGDVDRYERGGSLR